jgi:uncharacterized protein YndB with AHSA1/START domain
MSAKKPSASTVAERSAQHATFVIERNYDFPPAQVFAAWASPEAKGRWFVAPRKEWKPDIRELDFRVGGRERLVGTWASGTVTDFDSVYQDIVPDRRIVYSYAMHLDDRRISVSLATVEFRPAGAGTKLILTEQGAFLDGYDDSGSRERGTRALLDNLDAALKRAS